MLWVRWLNRVYRQFWQFGFKFHVTILWFGRCTKVYAIVFVCEAAAISGGLRVQNDQRQLLNLRINWRIRVWSSTFVASHDQLFKQLYLPNARNVISVKMRDLSCSLPHHEVHIKCSFPSHVGSQGGCQKTSRWTVAACQKLGTFEGR